MYESCRCCCGRGSGCGSGRCLSLAMSTAKDHVGSEHGAGINQGTLPRFLAG